MVKPVKVRSIWVKKGGERSAGEIASAVASTIWRVADKAVDNLGRENYDIITPARGFKLIAEFGAFLAHYCDRMAYSSQTPERRVEVLQAIANRLGGGVEEDILESVGPAPARHSQ